MHRNTKVVLASIVGVMIIAVGGAILVLSGEDGYQPSVGDNIKYNAKIMAGSAFQTETMEGVIEIRITSVSEDTYTYTMVPKGDLSMYLNQKSRTIDRNSGEMITPLASSDSSVREFSYEKIGKKTIVTDMGTLETNQYSVEGDHVSGFYYTEKETGLPVKWKVDIEGSYYSGAVTWVLTSSNIDYLKEVI